VSSGCISSAARDQEARADELVVLVVVAQHVTDVLAQEALDALAEFLHAVDVFLLHPPRAVRRVGFARLERLDLFLTSKFHETSVTQKSSMCGKRAHRLDRHRLVDGSVFSASYT
jgi:hypothetical protein